jgi:hypothetical protein
MPPRAVKGMTDSPYQACPGAGERTNTPLPVNRSRRAGLDRGAAVPVVANASGEAACIPTWSTRPSPTWVLALGSPDSRSSS